MNYHHPKIDNQDVFKKTRLHFTLNFSILGILFVVIIFGLTVGTIIGNVQRRIRENMDYTVNLMNVESFTFPPMNEEQCAVVAFYPDGTVKTTLEDYDSEMTSRIVNAVLRNEKNFRVSSHVFQSRGYVKQLAGGTCIVYAVYDCTYDNASVRHLIFIALLLIGCSSLLIIWAGWLLSGYNVRPLKEAFTKQKELIANASHELKTPLAIISANLGALSSSPDIAQGENKKWIENAEEQIDRMDSLIKDMLTLSRMDQDRNLEPTELDITSSLRCTILSLEANCFEKNITLTENIAEGVKINCYATEMERVFVILLDNALKYTPPGGEIIVTLTAGKNIVLSVKNMGKGVAKENLEKVFDRFFKEDGSRSDGKSFGLGLSIAKAIVNANGGKIVCNSDGESYTEFVVTL